MMVRSSWRIGLNPNEAQPADSIAGGKLPAKRSAPGG